MRVNTRYINSTRGTATAVVQIDSSRLRKPRLVEYLVFELKKHGVPEKTSPGRIFGFELKKHDVPEKTSPGRIFTFRAKETWCPRENLAW